MWAVMDIGTNSCRLLLAEQSGADRKIKKMQMFLRTTRIGEGMSSEDRSIRQAALNRTMAALTEFHMIIKESPAANVILVATQALREANNSDVLVVRIKKELGRDLEILSGEAEARLSYLGAVAGFAQETPVLVVDIGGGSTELAWKEKNGDFQAVSIPLGALRLFESPKTDRQIIDILQQALTNVRNPEELRAKAGYFLIGVGGTCTTTAAVALNMNTYNSELIQGYRLTAETIVDQYRLLKNLESHERLKIAGIQRGREDIIIPGLQILIAMMHVLEQKSITISDQDLLYGLILSADYRC